MSERQTNRRGRRADPNSELRMARVAERVARGTGTGEACVLEGVPPASYYRWRAAARKQRSEPTEELSQADARQAIVDAGRHLFLTRGFHVGMSEVAASAGVARQTIYNLFGSKQALLWEVLQRVYSRLVLTQEEPGGDSSLREVLEAFGRRYLAMAIDREAVGLNRLTISQQGKDPVVGRMVFDLANQTRDQGLRDRLAAALARLRERRELIDIEPLAAAAAFQSAIMGAPRLRELGGATQSETQLAAHLATVVAIFEAGLAPA